jgi:hypothetical protein
MMMISLKKNDKLIILVGVIVIIVAAIGIAVYNQPEVEEITEKIVTEKYYDIEWSTTTGSLSAISGFAGKRSPYEDTISINQKNLKTVTFNLSWIDDKALFRIFGRDTLTLEVTAPDGTVYEESVQSARRTKDGNIVITINVNREPSSGPIYADDLDTAETILED